MKQIILSFGILILALGSLLAQAPQKFNYQAVPRLASGDLLPNQSIKVRFVLSEDGTTLVKYAEEQIVSTSLHGVLSTAIGEGGPTGGFPHDFNALDWSQHQYYLAVSLDLDGNGSFSNNEVFSNNQLLSVPYALYAEKAGDAGVVDNDTDPTNEFQQLSLSGNVISLSNGGGSVILPPGSGTDSQTLTLAGNALSISNGNTVNLPGEVDGSTTNEIQQLSINGNIVSLTNGGAVTLPAEVDGSITNEIQQLTLSNGIVTLTNGGAITLPDASPTNEIQALSINGVVISLSNGGGAITLPPNQGTDAQTLALAGNALSISNGNTVNLPGEVDGSTTNEIQQLSINGNIVSLTNGGAVTLPAEVDGSITNEIQQLTLSNGIVTLTNGGAITLPDASPTNEIQALSINGDVISLSNGGGAITLPPNQGTDAQTLELTGNALSISNGNTVSLPAKVDGSITNEIQQLSINGNIVSLTDGGAVTLPAEVDGSITNEIQQLTLSNGIVTLTNGGAITLPDASPTNEIQQLSINGNMVSLTDGGAVTLPAEVDGSITNEIQALSIAGNQLSLSNGGGTVTLPGAGNSILAGTGIAVTTVADITTISALNTSDIWNATQLRGRPIDGMAPNPGFVMAYKNDAEGWVSYDNDLTITGDGKLEVAALRGRPIDGMAPNPGFVMAYKNDAEGWVSYDNDLTITGDGKLEVAALRGRPIDGMAPNPGFVMAYKNDAEGWVSYDNDLTITGDGKLEVAALRGRPIDGMAPNPGFVMAYKNDADGWVSYENDLAIANNRLEIAKIKGLNVNMAALGPNKALTCMDDGNGGLEFQCVDLNAASFPLNYNGNSGAALISITNSNTANTTAVNVTNGGRYGITGSTSKGDALPIPIDNYFDRNFTYPAGLRGRNTNTSQEGAGVYGSSVSPFVSGGQGGTGVGLGGFFQGGWIGLVGVGYENGHAGVVGLKKALSGNNNWPKEQQWGVYGESDNDGWAYAGYFVGDVKITDDLNVLGTLTKPAGSFRIDHPLDPANKYLYHSFVESPDMKNIYDGTVTTDADGFATVTLPTYFQELNKDFRYQLTCIGTFAQAIISQKVDNNQFQIQTDKPGVEVSWQVTGIRKDPYAEAHPIRTEVEKTGFEKGKYTYPELYGQPESLRIARKLTRN